jgi:hypothetical protein
VSLADDVAAALPGFRAQAEALMTDTCRIGVESDGGTRNEVTGKLEQTFTKVYEGPCRFKAGNTGANAIEAAGQSLTEQTATLKLPVSTSGEVRTGMVAIMTGSATDPDLVGIRARIKGMFPASGATSRRLPIEVVT